MRRYAGILRQRRGISVAVIVESPASRELRARYSSGRVEVHRHGRLRPGERQSTGEIIVRWAGGAEQKIREALTLASRQPRRHKGVGRIDLRVNPQRSAG